MEQKGRNRKKIGAPKAEMRIIKSPKNQKSKKSKARKSGKINRNRERDYWVAGIQPCASEICRGLEIRQNTLCIQIKKKTRSNGYGIYSFARPYGVQFIGRFQQNKRVCKTGQGTRHGQCGDYRPRCYVRGNRIL